MTCQILDEANFGNQPIRPLAPGVCTQTQIWCVRRQVSRTGSSSSLHASLHHHTQASVVVTILFGNAIWSPLNVAS